MDFLINKYWSILCDVEPNTEFLMHTVHTSTILGTVISTYTVDSRNILNPAMSSPTLGPNSEARTYGLFIVTSKLPKFDVTCT